MNKKIKVNLNFVFYVISEECNDVKTMRDTKQN